MKNILKYIYPLYIIKRIYYSIKEIYFLSQYIKGINDLDKSGILKEKGFTTKNDIWRTLSKGINLKPETLLYGGEGKELERFELSFIGKEMSKHNELFLQKGILEFIKTRADRVKSEEYYGYVVNVMFNFKHITVAFVTWSVLYIISLIYLISYIVTAIPVASIF
jgi:hypothetical protein